MLDDLFGAGRLTWFSPEMRARVEEAVNHGLEVSPTPSVLARRRTLRGSDRLHSLHYVVLGFSLAITLAAWWISQSQLEEKAQVRFDQEVDRAIGQLSTHIQHHQDALWSGVAAIKSNGGDMTRTEWAAFADALHLEEKYPGVNGIGVIHKVAPSALDAYLAWQRIEMPDYAVHPAHRQAVYLPISYIEPIEPNRAAVGLDMAHETNRFLGISMAAATGQSRITGPIVLVQDEGHTPGFLFFAPWYDDDDQFVGAVYAPFVARNLVAGALTDADRQVSLRILDDGELLFDDADEEFVEVAAAPAFERAEELTMYGRTWRFEVAATDSFAELSGSNEPVIILLGGIAIDLMLFAMFMTLSRSNRRALAYAEEATAELVSQTEKLSESNADLEKFAYVASHDLKTPLRGISNLVEWIRDDLGEHLEGSDAGAEVVYNFGRLDDQVERMNLLIDGLLAYSRASRSDRQTVGVLDLAEHLESLQLGLDLASDQIRHHGESSPRVVNPANLRQVIDNLVNNAFKHNDRSDSPWVEVVAEDHGAFVQVRVRDNGPGIAPEYRDRVFEIFESLAGDSTGIGLPIVRRLVARDGGTVALESQVGQGATFIVRWPSRLTEPSRQEPSRPEEVSV